LTTPPFADDPVRRLEEMRHALDQAAIVATTDQRGIITYVNDKFCEISKYSRGAARAGSSHHQLRVSLKEFIRDLWRTIARDKCGGARSGIGQRMDRCLG
jgi:PAS domain-containing protein